MMRVELKRVDTYTNNKTTVINIPEILSRILNSFNFFLEKLQESKPKIFPYYIEELERTLLSLVSTPIPDFDSLNIPKLKEIIQNLTNLQKLYITYSFQLLETPDELPTEAIKISWYKNDKSYLFPAYYRLLALCKVMGREEAITYYKNLLDKVIYERTELALDLKDLDFDWNVEEEDHPSYGIRFRVNRGKQGFRADKCVNFDILKDVNDPELTNVLCCYGDTASFESRNPNFVFTMTKTLMKGDSYCDKCFHDRRHVETIEHPPEEFWENLDTKIKNI